MGGKASLLLVLGFSLIFMVAGRNYSNMATSTTTNVSNYYLDAKAHTLAASGVNIVINKLFLDATTANQTFNYNLDNGTIAATLSTIDAYQNIRQLLSVGTFSGVSSTIKIILKPSLFSKFAYFSDNEGGTIWWAQGDTVWGPFHTNDNLNVNGHPVFMGKATIGGNINKANSSSSGVFNGGFQQGVQINIPSTGVTNVGANAGGGKSFTTNNLIYFEFREDSIRYRYSTSGSGSTWTYNLLSTFTPNGVIYCQNAEVHVKGTVKGNYTLAASGSTGNQGSIFIEDDVVYNTNPQTNPNSQDMLGLVAQNNVTIVNNTANNSNVNIQASIYCQNGSFGAQNYDTRPISGNINLYGGITQKIRGAVGTLGSSSAINHGFYKRYRYDDRLLVSYPPFYPGCGFFEIVSWFE